MYVEINVRTRFMKYFVFLIILFFSIPVFAQDSAEAAWADAEDSFESGNYIDAINKFSRIKRRFPYSKYAKVSDIRIGDAYFEQDQFPSAVEQFRGFRKLHPNHKLVPYASWRIAEAFYEDLPPDLFIYPPRWEREMSRPRETARELASFIRRFEKTKYIDQAKKRLREVRRIMADHEFYVASFHLNNNKPRAAAMRLTTLLENYSGLGLDPNSLFLLGRAYIELGDTKAAIVALGDLITNFPKHDLSLNAARYLKKHKLLESE